MNVLLLSWLLLSAPAAEPVDEAVEDSDSAKWERVERRATRTAHAGMITNYVGIGLVATGVIMVSANVKDAGSFTIVTGLAAGVVGTPLAAGGSLRGRRAVVELGHGRPPNGAGVAAALFTIPALTLGAVGALFTYPWIQDDLLFEDLAVPYLIGTAVWITGQVGANLLVLKQLKNNREARMPVSIVPTTAHGSVGICAVGVW